MRQLLPEPGDALDVYAAYHPADPGAALLRLNMVGSVDGAAVDRAGRSTGLGGQGDREVFRTLRALADGILVGAGTARTEGYGPHRLRADLRERRALDGRALPAPIIVVSRSLDLDLDAPLFTDAESPTIVVTSAAASEEAQRAVGRAGVLLVAGEDEVDLALAVRMLRTEFGLRHLLCEGGPTLNAALLAAGLVDELCLTVAPRMVGLDQARTITAPLPESVELSLDFAAEHAGELYLRYSLTVCS